MLPHDTLAGMMHPTFSSMRLDFSSHQPAYEQIGEAIVHAIRSGQLPPGTRLPAIRTLAGHVNVAVNTVAKAYRELERVGVIEGRGRLGTFVVDGDGDAAATAAHTFVRAMKDLGVNEERSHELVTDAWKPSTYPNSHS
ncbi:GntR family transcriptional regulator [Actinomyces vulturis]|uniref:GntR family transcriptional regulator n=1 Tax=Actinomyces vulturis TaxID=1857645 RepID=UPI000A5AD69F|nr:GntR family transcriptional regulator [Actinomyces vulturis]